MARGLLIVFEGLDRSGKSTQCARLHESLAAAGHKVKLMRFPDRTTAIGACIDAYLRGHADVEDQAIHLLFAANRWEAAAAMRRDLEAGASLIVDRYSFSGAVYSAAKANPALPLDWAWQAEVGLPSPDLTLFLGVSPDVAARRGGFGAERYERPDLQARVAALFDDLLARRLRLEPPELARIDADQSADAVHSEILRLASAMLDHEPTRDGPLKTLRGLAPEQ